jgi:hypothetical protein
MMTPEQAAKANTQLVDIASAILPPDTRRWTEGREVRFEHSCGLSINLDGRGWCMHRLVTNGKTAGGKTAIGLVQACEHAASGTPGNGLRRMSGNIQSLATSPKPRMTSSVQTRIPPAKPRPSGYASGDWRAPAWLPIAS